MKKIMFAFVMLAVSAGVMALSRSKVREYARFLSDRMAYELRLSSGQYDDCYEINYDFIDAVGDLLDDVECGDADAIDSYYRYLDYRNEDLSCVLSSSQYSRLLSKECFYRPFCIYDGSWAFRPYMVYTNRNYFYMSIPFGYNGYYGAHGRRYFSAGFYVGRYSGPRYVFTPIRHRQDYVSYPRRDFGPIVSGHGYSGRPGYRPRPEGPRPGGPQARPDRPQPRPNGPQNRPNGPQMRPNGPQNRPNGPQARPNGPQNRTNGPQTRPDGSQNRPNGSQTRPGGSQSRPSGPQMQPNQGQKDSPRDGGGGVVRRGRG